MKGRNARGNESERMTDGQEQRTNERKINIQELIDEGTKDGQAGSNGYVDRRMMDARDPRIKELTMDTREIE